MPWCRSWACITRPRLSTNLPDGALFLIYLVLYSAGRFIITFWSSYQIVAFGLNQAQLISLIGLIVGLPLLAIVLRRRPLAVVVP